MTKIEDFKTLQKHALQIDTRFEERLVEKNYQPRLQARAYIAPSNFGTTFPAAPRTTSTFVPTAARHQPSTTSTSTATPMELDATFGQPRAKLTTVEKQGRRDRGECLYCGIKGHRVSECPKLQHQPNISASEIEVIEYNATSENA